VRSNFTLSGLIERSAEGFELDFLFFWRSEPPTRTPLGPFVLSQWYEHPFVDEGNLYGSAEHLMMVKKAELFGDFDAAKQIKTADSPREAKALGRQVRNFNEELWLQHRSQVVESVSLAKFSSDEDLKEYLLSTGTSVLVEASPHDRVWGIGLEEVHPDALDPHRWQGENLLGFALMAAREQLAGS